MVTEAVRSVVERSTYSNYEIVVVAEFETSARVTAAMSNLFLYDLPLNYYAGAQRRFTAVTAEQVAATAKKYITPEWVPLTC